MSQKIAEVWRFKQHLVGVSGYAEKIGQFFIYRLNFLQNLVPRISRLEIR